MRYRRKPTFVEAVRFEGQAIPNLVKSDVWEGEWEIRAPHGSVTARPGDYIYLGDSGEAVGAARPIFFETYYEPADGEEAQHSPAQGR
jgi:hypothetical protein